MAKTRHREFMTSRQSRYGRYQQRSKITLSLRARRRKYQQRALVDGMAKLAISDMSSSKRKTQGHSLYLENWNPTANKYVVACSMCGLKGHSPTIESDDFLAARKGRIIHDELKRLIDVLVLDDSGHCPDCADRMKRTFVPDSCGGC